MLENSLDREITLYEELENLYSQKKEVLISNNTDELLEIDTQILNKMKIIQDMVQERLNISQSITDKEVLLSEIIEKCRQIDEKQAQRLEEKKEKINSLVKNLQKLDTINEELTKHGIKLSSKILQIILNNVLINSTEYDKKGKVINNPNDLKISSINKEV